ncbi:MAG: TIGR00366 family protein [Gemmatimonadetes bacterium]|jgi:short-chain fatty acids transporter|nr:TIGR00366 family protein [Gemmatimonadota bacterium]HAC07394.1 serine--pyruvate aminotransferase [Gemmatimonadota bacterium]HBE00425.1 serine--pyruvate aminotransferase [Gemmatimonadota bacterium]HIC54932.1 short-chain fatty acid transporter [Gemmatimonadota bacterium]HIN52596.1 short-chain fatty acid transporter [Gemmatimonadota bacterium]|tara:strand:+ start:659 stop:2098 length:1440 start_codon:yes stop_codon:yes gene_type:complete
MPNAQPADPPRLTPVQKFGEAIADRVERWMPSPFLFAIILTYVAGLTAFLSEGSGLREVASAWYGGFWSLLQFGMQMVLILVTASVVAYHPRVKGMITRLVGLPRNGPQAVLLVAIGSILASWISWGLGLIFGAILAREMGKQAQNRRMAVHYPLLAVAGYIGLGLTWGWGMSSSPGLLQAIDGNVLMELGFIDRVVPATEWVFHSYPLMLTALALVYVCITLFLLCPPAESCRGIEYYVDLEDDATAEPEANDSSASESDPRGQGNAKPSIADRLDNSKILGGVLALTGVVLSANVFLTEGLGALDLNVFNFAFLMIGLLLYMSPSKYQKDFYQAVSGTAGVILLFPFYAGIIGIMTGTGLVDTMTEALLSIATEDTFAVTAWITGGVLNVFVPSAGGEWAIIGGPMLAAGADLGIPPGQTIVAYAAGDAHTNLLNPFWAIPLLAITGLRARDMFGYAITMMLLLIPFLAAVFYFLPY